MAEASDSIRLRNVKSAVVEGADAAALTAALNTWFAAAGESVLVAVYQVSDFAVLVLYAE